MSSSCVACQIEQVLTGWIDRDVCYRSVAKPELSVHSCFSLATTTTRCHKWRSEKNIRFTAVLTNIVIWQNLVDIREPCSGEFMPAMPLTCIKYDQHALCRLLLKILFLVGVCPVSTNNACSLQHWGQKLYIKVFAVNRRKYHANSGFHSVVKNLGTLTVMMLKYWYLVVEASYQ